MSNNNYYQKTWNEPDSHGDKFWKKVDFSAPEYKYQEMVFREYLRSLDKSKIKTVLEVGVGSGRMTKIMLEQFPDSIYYGVDLNNQFDVSKIKNQVVVMMNLNICSKEFDAIFTPSREQQQFDLILVSEVFLHIKPEDIENIIKKLSKIGKQIINIDWAYEPQKSDWCFIHPYDELYSANGAEKVNMIPMKNIKQGLFHYRFVG